jgi:hypothetical protein
MNNAFNCSNYIASYDGKASGQWVEGKVSDIMYGKGKAIPYIPGQALTVPGG